MHAAKQNGQLLIGTVRLLENFPNVQGLGLHSGSHSSCGDFFLVGETPLDLVALAGGASLATLLSHGAFEGAATAHFFKDTFSIQLSLQALEGAIDRFSFTYGDGTHDRYDCC